MRFATVLAVCLHLAREWYRSGCAAPPPSLAELIARLEYSARGRREIRIADIGMTIAITDFEARALGLRITEPCSNIWRPSPDGSESHETESAPPVESQPKAAASEPDISADKRPVRRKRTILNLKIVRNLRMRHAAGEPLQRIAAELGISYGAAWSAAMKRTWKDAAA